MAARTTTTMATKRLIGKLEILACYCLPYLHCLSIQEDSIELLSIHLATYAIDLSLSEAKELAGVGLRAQLKLWELVIDIENDVEGCCDTAGVVCRLCLVMEDENSE
ncbi:hypothetical protein KY290_036207 [Solanum tuberosum]|uniref:Uncharacterized protein n=1 Tax=Solanum tuberosum TaxID=4113 RepID=A0ABQ7TS00_SOLTU|nr:hypothetical protein KY290_036207 [Solanum tuberosum]